MSIIKVIVQGCYGSFEPTSEFEKVILSKGHKGIWSIEARTDKDLIEYVETNAIDNFLRGRESYQYVQVVEVDTSKQWTIEDYDGAESIQYIQIEVVDESLNFVKLK